VGGTCIQALIKKRIYCLAVEIYEVYSMPFKESQLSYYISPLRGGKTRKEEGGRCASIEKNGMGCNSPNFFCRHAGSCYSWKSLLQ